MSKKFNPSILLETGNIIGPSSGSGYGDNNDDPIGGNFPGVTGSEAVITIDDPDSGN